MYRFVKLLIARRRLREMGHEQQRVSLNQLISEANKSWHGTKLDQPDWGPHSRSIAFTAEVKEQRLLLHMILNAYWEPLDFELPPIDKGGKNPWCLWIDTSLDSPNDICEWKTSPPVSELAYRAASRSVVVLWRNSSER